MSEGTRGKAAFASALIYSEGGRRNEGTFTDPSASIGREEGLAAACHDPRDGAEPFSAFVATWAVTAAKGMISGTTRTAHLRSSLGIILPFSSILSRSPR